MSKQHKELRNKQRTAEKQSRSRKILRQLGLWDEIKGTNLVGPLLALHFPRIELALATDASPTEETHSILRRWEKALNNASFNCPLLGEHFPINDYFTSVKPLIGQLRAAVGRDRGSHSFLMDAKERTATLGSVKTDQAAIQELVNVLEEILIRQGRIDQTLYFLEWEFGYNSNHKPFNRVLLHSLPCDRRDVKTLSGYRKAYRCGQPVGLGGIEWVKWPSAVMGLTGEDRDYDVFVQGHALDNLYRRALFIKDGEWLVHDFLWQSLRTPTLARMPGEKEKYLVEYYLYGYKLGYLVAQHLDDIVLVESFLFLTMNGTPEGNQLWQKLRLRKEDKQHLELDQIRTFLMTDMQFDSELVAMLTECGCGHLFRILKEPMVNRCMPGYAAQIRKYLNL